MNSLSCDFAENKTGELKSFLPAEIKGYVIDDEKFYVSKEVYIDSIPVKFFLEYLLDGIADLYFLRHNNQDYYFLEKEGNMYNLTNEERQIKYTPQSVTESRRYGAGGVYMQRSRKYIGMLSIAFSDCPEIKDQIYSTDFDFKQLINVTKEYHNKMCTEYQCIDYSKSTRAKLSVEPFIGLVNTANGFQCSYQKINTTNFQFGVNIRIQPLQSHYVWNLIIGANFSENSFQKVFYHDLMDPLSPAELKVSYSIIRIPITIEYSLPGKKISPFIFTSYTNAFLASKDYEILYEDDESIRNILFGIGGGLGCKFFLNDKVYCTLRCQYEHMGSYNRTHKFIDCVKLNSFISNAGVGFRI
jgi:hypothetical protein